MASVPPHRTSLSARSPTPAQPHRQPPNPQTPSLQHAPAAASTLTSTQPLCTVLPLSIPVPTSTNESIKTVPAILHLPQNNNNNHNKNHTQSQPHTRTAAILLSGAGGGLVGPSCIYLSMADKLSSLQRGIPVLRLDYRHPARTRYCVPDALAGMSYLQKEHAITRFVLVGWSYGGAVVFSVAGRDERVVGVATVASQTAETGEGVREVARKGVPMLLLHGTDDRTLSPECSKSLYEAYGRAAVRGGAKRELKLFEGDDHALTRSAARAEELLCEFVMKQAGEEIRSQEQLDVVQKPLVGPEERVDRMREGGDLRGESIE